MKAFLALFCTLFVAGSVSAQGVYNIAKQQAKNAVANENKAQQAIDSSGQPAPAPPPPNNSNVQPNPALEATMRNIAGLRADFENLEANSTNTPPLDNDLTTAAQGAKPSPTTVAKLAQDLATAVGGNKNLHAQHQKLAQYVHAIFNGSHLSSTQQQMICDNVQKILLDSGVSDYDAAKVVKDIKKIGTATE
jgi:flagellar motor protein MotB